MKIPKKNNKNKLENNKKNLNEKIKSKERKKKPKTGKTWKNLVIRKQTETPFEIMGYDQKEVGFIVNEILFFGAFSALVSFFVL